MLRLSFSQLIHMLTSDLVLNVLCKLDMSVVGSYPGNRHCQLYMSTEAYHLEAYNSGSRLGIFETQGNQSKFTSLYGSAKS